MHLAHSAGALTPQHRQDGYFGVGWKRLGSGLFGKGSGGHASSIIRIDSYVNEIIRMTGDKPASGSAAPLDERTQSRERKLLDLERDIDQDGLSQLSRDEIERLRERVVLREIIVINLERPSEHPERASGCDDQVILGKPGRVNSGCVGFDTG